MVTIEWAPQSAVIRIRYISKETNNVVKVYQEIVN